MSSSIGQSKIAAEKYKRLLLELVSQPGNDFCADCKSKAPRWASHNLGIFICVRCASIHRKIGTHVTKVKSVTLDEWTKEQVETMSNIGNIKANNYWNPDERRHPLPANLEQSERDSELEKYIRSKYEHKRFRAPMASSLPLCDSKSATSSQSRPIAAPARVQSLQPSSTSTPTSASSQSMLRSGTAASHSEQSTLRNYPSVSDASVSSPSPQINVVAPHHQASMSSSMFNDLISLQSHTADSSLPLQYHNSAPLASNPTGSFASPTFHSLNCYAPLSVSPTNAGSHSPVDPSDEARSASVPISGQATNTSFSPYMLPGMSVDPLQPMQPFHTGMAVSGRANPVYGYDMSSGSSPALMSSPFAQQPQPMRVFGNHTMAPAITPPSLYEIQQAQHASLAAPQGLVYPQPQITGGIQGHSPYAQQAQQATQVFQNMSASNPFGSQWINRM